MLIRMCLVGSEYIVQELMFKFNGYCHVVYYAFIDGVEVRDINWRRSFEYAL